VVYSLPFHEEIFQMRKILLVAIMAAIGPAAFAKDVSNVQLAQAAQDAPAGAPQAVPAPAASPTASAPDSGQPAADGSKPQKKRVARRGRNWQADEAGARSIAAKYGVSW
jgi:hypothetical protein